MVIGVITGRQVRNSFADDLKLTAVSLVTRIHPTGPMTSLTYEFEGGNEVARSAAAGDAAIRIVSNGGTVLFDSPHAPDLGLPKRGVHDHLGYRVASDPVRDQAGRVIAWLQYAKPIAHVRHTVARIRLFLIFGVLAGTVLALLAGLAIARP